jgi:hypothetical protein
MSVAGEVCQHHAYQDDARRKQQMDGEKNNHQYSEADEG